jgi:hypothetical protein
VVNEEMKVCGGFQRRKLILWEFFLLLSSALMLLIRNQLIDNEKRNMMQFVKQWLNFLLQPGHMRKNNGTAFKLLRYFKDLWPEFQPLMFELPTGHIQNKYHVEAFE